jgi:predicted nucleotidyltransferase
MVEMDQIFALSRRIAEEFHPQKIILFGSYAYGEPHESSDVDLLVVMPFRGHAFDQATKILRRAGSPLSVDLLVRRPSDTAQRYREFDPLIREALDRGRLLYERDGQGMGKQGRGRLRQRPARGESSEAA